jgi:uncharacterized protein (DUF2384 family)
MTQDDGAAPKKAATQVPAQRFQLEHPTLEAIQARAIEVFGSEELAGQWMRTPLPVLDGATPEQYANSGDPAKQREVLTILGRIDYGLFG